jgi:hypothetical protein
MTHSCKYDKVIEIIHERTERIEGKLDNVLRFKWVITGGAVAITGLCGLIVTVINIFK